MKDQGNLLLAIVLSLLILLGFQYFFEAPQMKKESEKKKHIEQTESLINNNSDDYDFSKVDGAVASPIIGFAFDGYPIYGAYGTVDGEVTLMRSNYILKDGETGYNGIDDYTYSANNGRCP